MKRTLGLLIFILSVSACSTVQPWERGRLAKAQMQWNTNPMQTGFDQLVYSSKEASFGGSSTAGGGCGCN